MNEGKQSMKKWIWLPVTITILFTTACNILNSTQLNQDEMNTEYTNNSTEGTDLSILKNLYDAYYSGNETAVKEFMDNLNQVSKICSKIDEKDFIWYSETNSLSSGIRL